MGSMLSLSNVGDAGGHLALPSAITTSEALPKFPVRPLAAQEATSHTFSMKTVKMVEDEDACESSAVYAQNVCHN